MVTFVRFNLFWLSFTRLWDFTTSVISLQSFCTLSVRIACLWLFFSATSTWNLTSRNSNRWLNSVIIKKCIKLRMTCSVILCNYNNYGINYFLVLINSWIMSHLWDYSLSDSGDVECLQRLASFDNESSLFRFKFDFKSFSESYDR